MGSLLPSPTPATPTVLSLQKEQKLVEYIIKTIKAVATKARAESTSVSKQRTN
jgi:hypothetical protein